MKYPNRSIKLAVSALVMLAWARASAQEPPLIRDEAQMFSTATITEGVQTIRKIKRLFQKDVVIETFKDVPAEKAKAFMGLNAKGKQQFLIDWANSQSKILDVAGIYVQIVSSLGHFEIIIDPATLKKAFTQVDREMLRDLLVSRFKLKDFDKGLTDGLTLIQDRLEVNVGPATVVPVANAVKDYAGMFSRAAIVRADQQIKNLNQKLKIDVVVETFPNPPAALRKSLEKASGKEKEELFAGWLRERQKASPTSGLHVLISKEPPQLRVGVGKLVDKKILTSADRDRLISFLRENFKERQLDEGLEGTLALVRERAEKNITPTLLPAANVAVLVSDEGGFFSPETIKKADEVIRAIRQRYNRDVMIETYKSVPPDLAKGVDLTNEKQRSQFFEAWAEKRLQASGRKGILVLISKDPKSLYVVSSEDAYKWKAIPGIIESNFEKGDFDKGLTDALVFAEKTLAGKTLTLAKKESTDPEKKAERGVGAVKPRQEPPPGAKAQPEFNMMWIVWGVLILLGIWVLARMFRRPAQPYQQQQAYPPPQQGYPPPQQGYPSPQQPHAQQQQQRPPGYQPPPQPGYPPGGYPQQPQAPAQGGGGGGFVSGMLGGAAGAVVGNILYDKFGRPQPASAAPPPASPPQSPGYSQGQRDQGSYGGSGGDFGAEPTSATGGDFGAEQPPVQDVGGGDWGGGQEPQPDAGGGDFSGGYDTGSDASASDAGGGDFGGDAGGGDWGGGSDAGGGDFGGGGDSGGGDY